MSSAMPTIRDVLFVTVRAAGEPSRAVLAVGVVFDDDSPAWGETIVDASTTYGLPTDRIITLLRGQRAGSFRGLIHQLAAVQGELLAVQGGAAVLFALQHALLAATARSRHLPVASLLTEEYGLAPPDLSARPQLFLEVSDYAATAPLIDRMIACRPDGLGYCLTSEHIVEAIGVRGEYLQGFVRELAQRVVQQSAGEDYRPAIYLGLNGAPGVLAGDVERHIGKVLGHIVGLRAAAGEHTLYVEEPLRLADPVAQSTGLRWLYDAFRPVPGSRRPLAEAYLVDSARVDEPSTWALPLEAHAMSLPFPLTGSLDDTVSGLAELQRRAAKVFWRMPKAATWRQSRLVADVALAGQATAVIVNSVTGDGHRMRAVDSRLAETVAWLRARA